MSSRMSLFDMRSGPTSPQAAPEPVAEEPAVQLPVEAAAAAATPPFTAESSLSAASGFPKFPEDDESSQASLPTNFDELSQSGERYLHESLESDSDSNDEHEADEAHRAQAEAAAAADALSAQAAAAAARAALADEQRAEVLSPANLAELEKQWQDETAAQQRLTTAAHAVSEEQARHDYLRMFYSAASSESVMGYQWTTRPRIRRAQPAVASGSDEFLLPNAEGGAVATGDLFNAASGGVTQKTVISRKATTRRKPKGKKSGSGGGGGASSSASLGGGGSMQASTVSLPFAYDAGAEAEADPMADAASEGASLEVAEVAFLWLDEVGAKSAEELLQAAKDGRCDGASLDDRAALEAAHAFPGLRRALEAVFADANGAVAGPAWYVFSEYARDIVRWNPGRFDRAVGQVWAGAAW